MDRRSLFAGTAALAAGAMLGARQASTQPAANQSPGVYRMKLGSFEITAATDGIAYRPLTDGFVRNASLVDVQQALKDAFLPTDKVPIPFTPLVVNTGSKLVLLDAGNGQFGAPTSGQLVANLTAAGIDPKAVNTVIISHFHGDHINGLRGKDGALTYPNAEIMVPAPEWAFWMDDANMDKAPEGLKPGFQGARRVFAPIADKVTRYEPGKELLTGIHSVAAYGHTPGHCTFAIESGNQRMLYLADITNNPLLFVRNPDWSAVFDQDADMARAARRRALDMAAQEKMLVAGYHYPFPAMGHIVKDGNRFDVVPMFWTPTL